MAFGPSRSEYAIRLVLSVFGLGLMATAIMLHGWPEGPGLVEVVGFGGLFFGGSALMAVRGLLRHVPDRTSSVQGNPAVTGQMEDLPPFDDNGR